MQMSEDIIADDAIFEVRNLSTRFVEIESIDDDKTGSGSVYSVFLDGVDVAFQMDRYRK
jgi:hypothetical protein